MVNCLVYCWTVHTEMLMVTTFAHCNGFDLKVKIHTYFFIYNNYTHRNVVPFLCKRVCV